MQGHVHPLQGTVPYLHGNDIVISENAVDTEAHAGQESYENTNMTVVKDAQLLQVSTSGHYSNQITDSQVILSSHTKSLAICLSCIDSEMDLCSGNEGLQFPIFSIPASPPPTESHSQR